MRPVLKTSGRPLGMLLASESVNFQTLWKDILMVNKLLILSFLSLASLSFAGLVAGDQVLGSGSERGSECSFKIERIQRNSIQLSGVILGSRLQSAQFNALTTIEKYGRKMTLYSGPIVTSSEGKLTTSYAIELDENQNIQRFERDLWNGHFGSQRISNSACTSFRKD